MLGVLGPLPIYLYAFSYQVAVPAVHLDLRARSLPRMRKIAVLSLLLCLLLYAAVGASGLLSLVHAPSVDKNVLLADLYASQP